MEPKPGVSSSATPAAGPAALGFGSKHPEPMPCLPSPPKIHCFALILQPWLGSSWLSPGLFQAAPSHPQLKAGEKSEVFSMACKYRTLQEGLPRLPACSTWHGAAQGPTADLTQCKHITSNNLDDTMMDFFLFFFKHKPLKSNRDQANWCPESLTKTQILLRGRLASAAAGWIQFI